MKYLISIVFILVSIGSHAETRIVPVDSVGNPQYHKQQYVVQGDRVYETDSVGNVQYHKPSYKVEGNKVHQTDTVGNVQYHKPSYSIDSKGKSK